MRELGVDAQSLESRMVRTGRTVENVGRKLQGTSRNVALGIGAAVFEFGSFDAAMQQSISIMGDVDDVMRGRMIDTARQVARDLNISATSAAESYFFLASAGLDAEQSIAALPQVATFAKAGMFDMATATDLATDAQSALGLTVDDSAQNLGNLTRVTDVLVRGNQLANASVEQFSTALTNKAGAALRTVNKDVEEGVAVLAAFADQGVKGEDAGERLSIVLRDVTRAAQANRDGFADLGIQVFDAEGNLRNMADVVAEFETGLHGMSDAELAATLDTLGLTRAVGDSLRQLLGTSDAIREYETELRSAGGAVDEVAGKQLAAFNEQLGQDIVVVREAGAVLGERLAPAVLTVTGAVADMADAFTRLPVPVQTTVAGLAAVTAVTAPLLIAGGQAIQMFGRLGIAAQGTRLAPLIGSVGAATSALGPAALAVGGATVAFRLLNEAVDFDADVAALAQEFRDLGKVGASTEEITRTLGGRLEDVGEVVDDVQSASSTGQQAFAALGDALNAVTLGLGGFTTTSEQAANRFGAVGEALGELVRAGEAEAAADALAEVIEQIEGTDLSVGELLNLMPDLDDALAETGVTAEQFVAAIRAGQDPTELLTQAARDAAGAGDELTNSLYDLEDQTGDTAGEQQTLADRIRDATNAKLASIDPTFRAIEAEERAAEASATYAEVMADENSTLADQDSALRDVIRAQAELQSAQADALGTTSDATDQIAELARAAGLSEDDIGRLTDRVGDLKQQLADLRGTYTARVEAIDVSGGQRVGLGQIGFRHRGGIIEHRDPGRLPGLKPNERITALEVGEEVLTDDDPRHADNLNGTLRPASATATSVGASSGSGSLEAAVREQTALMRELLRDRRLMGTGDGPTMPSVEVSVTGVLDEPMFRRIGREVTDAAWAASRAVA